MGTGEGILVVDDDQGFLEVIKVILRGKGYGVETAQSAREAISKSEECFYNIAILDISLPDLTGTDLLSTLLGIHPDVLAIMLTGHSSVQNAVQALNRGAFAYLEKPLDPDRLLAVIEQGMAKQRLVFENRRLLQELEQRNRETGILLSVSQGVSQSLDLQQILDSALNQVVHSMPAEAGHVHLSENGRLVLKGCYGFTAGLAEGMGSVEIDQDVIGNIFKRAEPIAIENIAANGSGILASLAREGYQAYAGVPLAMGGEVMGVMGIITTTEHYFTHDEMELLSVIGREISIAVRNAQLYEEASSARALRELDNLRAELLANVSHELRTPLTIIKGFASTILQSDINFDQQTLHDFLQTIDKEADKLNRLITKLLMMSRLEAGALESQKEWHNIADVIESIEDRLHNLAPKHRIQNMVPRHLPQVAIDTGQFEEVITNLVENATKYSPEGTQIAIEAHTNAGEVIVSVLDEGTGIPPEFRQRIFERFYQVAGPMIGHMPGTGLGLSICRGIVEAHGGKIWADGEAGEGAKLSFSLPTGEGE